MAIELDRRASSPDSEDEDSPPYQSPFLPYPEPIHLSFSEHDIRFPNTYDPPGFGGISTTTTINPSLSPSPSSLLPHQATVPSGMQAFAFTLGGIPYLDPTCSIVIGTSTAPGPAEYVAYEGPAINDGFNAYVHAHEPPIYSSLYAPAYAPPNSTVLAVPSLHSHGEADPPVYNGAAVSSHQHHQHHHRLPTDVHHHHFIDEDPDVFMSSTDSNSNSNSNSDDEDEDGDEDDAHSDTSSSDLTEIGSDEFADCFEERAERLWLPRAGQGAGIEMRGMGGGGMDRGGTGVGVGGGQGRGGGVGVFNGGPTYDYGYGHGPLFHSHGTSQYRYPLPVDGPEQKVRLSFLGSSYHYLHIVPPTPRTVPRTDLSTVFLPLSYLNVGRWDETDRNGE